jgi:hypothetical protein
MAEYRAHFDLSITFVNGGSLTGKGFRLDLPSAEVTEPEVARLLVQHLGLALGRKRRAPRACACLKGMVYLSRKHLCELMDSIGPMWGPSSFARKRPRCWRG